MADNGGLSQFVLLGEQNLLSAVPFAPLTTLCVGEDQTQCTVSPTWMVRLAGLKTSEPPGPTMTV
jgi:hypothetical protein